MILVCSGLALALCNANMASPASRTGHHLSRWLQTHPVCLGGCFGEEPIYWTSQDAFQCLTRAYQLGVLAAQPPKAKE